MFQVKNRAYIALLIGSILYGTTGFFLSLIHDMSITSIIFYRLFFGLCVISVFIIISRTLEELKIVKKRFLLLLQVVCGLTSLIFYFICVEKTCFSIAVLLQSTAPIYVILASPYLLNEKVRKASIVALIIAIIGVYFVVHPDRGFEGFEFSENYYLGVVAGLISGLLSAFCIINIIILKRNYSEFAIAFWTTALCCLFMSPFAFESSLNVLISNIFPLLASGIFIVGIGGILTTIGFANLKSQTGSLLSLIQLVVGVFFDFTVLGVNLPAGIIEGCVLVLTASVIVCFEGSSIPTLKSNACIRIIEDCSKSLFKIRSWIMPLQTFTIKSKK